MKNNGSMNGLPEDVKPLLDALSLKQRAFVLHYVENGGNATQAAKAAGYKAGTDHVAAEVGYENLIKPEIQQTIEALLNKAKLTPATAALKLYEGLNATKAHVLRHRGRVVEHEVVDFRARAAYLDMYYRITGAYKQPPASATVCGPLVELPVAVGIELPPRRVVERETATTASWCRASASQTR